MSSFYYFLSDVEMLNKVSGVRLLFKLSGEGDCLCAFVFTRFHNDEGEGECCLEASEVRLFNEIKRDRDIFPLWIRMMFPEDDSGIDEEALCDVFTNLINYTTDVMENKPPSMNYLSKFPDKAGLKRIFHDQPIFQDSLLNEAYNSCDNGLGELNEAETNLLSLIQKKITAISHEKAQSLYKLIEEDCVKRNKNLRGYKLYNIVLKRLLDDYGLYSDESYFFTSTQFYNKFRNNQPVKKLHCSPSEILHRLYEKDFLGSFKTKINNYAPIYYKKKKFSTVLSMILVLYSHDII